ncbi:DUF4267 domain-containing protein [Fibrisoma montanum]|uniref:DUF4267 domain-containing protein n=1 Tax=Fibrisoma montanum TaxID=2305895 RepID=A0A418MFS4_9BACT|nr:DUF4267 domain-containing protein [Fibrisoma montanum]RIV25573.1 DUF4267 domain-containing protein [Fibrisoma montanum]
MGNRDSLSNGQRLVTAGLGGVLAGLGVAYVVAPELIEQLYGVDVAEQGNYSLHYAIGVRDVCYGLVLLALTGTQQRRALVLVVGLGLLLPLGDACIVVFGQGAALVRALPHLAGVVTLGGVAAYLKK